MVTITVMGISYFGSWTASMFNYGYVLGIELAAHCSPSKDPLLPRVFGRSASWIPSLPAAASPLQRRLPVRPPPNPTLRSHRRNRTTAGYGQVYTNHRVQGITRGKHTGHVHYCCWGREWSHTVYSKGHAAWCVTHSMFTSSMNSTVPHLILSGHKRGTISHNRTNFSGVAHHRMTNMIRLFYCWYLFLFSRF